MFRIPFAVEPQQTPAPAVDDLGTERRWVVRVDGTPAAHHVLRALGPGGMALIARSPLAPWTSAMEIAPDLEWTRELLPLVLRADADAAAALGVDGSAPALVLYERGRDRTGVHLEHRAVVRAEFGAHMRPAPGRR